MTVSISSIPSQLQLEEPPTSLNLVEGASEETPAPVPAPQHLVEVAVEVEEENIEEDLSSVNNCLPSFLF